MTVLLAEHDIAVAEMLARYLARDGQLVRLAALPELALAGLAEGTDAVAVVDLTMPGLDPRHVRQALHPGALHPGALHPGAGRTAAGRTAAGRTAVIFLVAPGPRPRGLNGAGARRWLVRPFAPRQLVVTVRELMGTSDNTSNGGNAGTRGSAGDKAFGGLRLDGSRRCLALAGGREVPLTGTEFAMLAAMLAAPGRPRSRGQLLAAAGRKGSDRAADVHIAALRAKIGLPSLIRTVRGAGYSIGDSAV
jgi:DNA-binding response OmpR family regulator